MFGVYAPDADAVRSLLPNREALLGRPYCSYLVFLAREVDHEALAFLTRFSSAIHVESGECVAFLLLLDEASVVGNSQIGNTRVSPPGVREELPIVQEDAVVRGQHAVAQKLFDRAGTMPSRAIYRASPRWSMKFADSIGLSRALLPCIVAFDDPRASGTDDCVVVSLSNADLAFRILRSALDLYTSLPETQVFIRQCEELTHIEGLLRRALELQAQLPRFGRVLWTHLPADPVRLIHLLSMYSYPEGPLARRTFARWAQFARPEHEAIASKVLAATETTEAAKLTQECWSIARVLRTRWLTSDQESRINAGVIKRVARALELMNYSFSRTEVNDVLEYDLAERVRFLEEFEAASPISEQEFVNALLALRSDSPEDRIAAEVERLGAEVQNKIDQLAFSSFLPYLSRAMDEADCEPQSVRSQEISRNIIRRSASASVATVGFASALLDLLEWLGVISK